MKIIEETTMTNIIEDAFGEVDLDLVMIPKDILKHLGVYVINTDHHKVEAWYDRDHEWMVPYSKMEEEEDE